LTAFAISSAVVALTFTGRTGFGHGATLSVRVDVRIFIRYFFVAGINAYA
jgi:hypothetical protein